MKLGSIAAAAAVLCAVTLPIALPGPECRADELIPSPPVPVPEEERVVLAVSAPGASRVRVLLASPSGGFEAVPMAASGARFEAAVPVRSGVPIVYQFQAERGDGTVFESGYETAGAVGNEGAAENGELLEVLKARVAQAEAALKTMEGLDPSSLVSNAKIEIARARALVAVKQEEHRKARAAASALARKLRAYVERGTGERLKEALTLLGGEAREYLEPDAGAGK